MTVSQLPPQHPMEHMQCSVRESHHHEHNTSASRVVYRTTYLLRDFLTSLAMSPYLGCSLQSNRENLASC